MEKDLKNYRDLLYQRALEIDNLEKQITQKETDINQLKERIKNEALNPTEKRLLDVRQNRLSGVEALKKVLLFLADGK